MKWYERVDRIDRRVPYFLLFLFILLPLVRPMGLPIAVSNEVRTAYQTIDALKPGQVVILSPTYGPGTDAEMLPQHLAVAKHLMSKGVKIIAVHLVVDGVMYSERVFETLAPKYKYEYGTDYVIMPFKAGEATAVASLGRDIHALYTEDYYRKPTSSLPLMQQVKGIKDIALIIDFMPGNSLLWYLQQINAVYGTTVTGGVTAVCIPTMMPFVASGQMKGILGGLAGAAEYEQILREPARASAGMDAQSLGHLVVLFFIALGNAATIARRRDTKKAR